MNSLRLPFAPILLLLALVTTACSGSDGASTSIPSLTRTPIADGITLTDFLGREVTVPRNPGKVVALSPTTVELVYAVGGTVVGRASSADYPPEAQSVPDVGTSYQPNIEKIIALQPDLVIADSQIQPELKDQVDTIGAPVMFVGAGVFADVPKALRLVGLATGHDDAGEAAATGLEQHLAKLQAAIQHTHPKVLIVNGTPDDFFAATPASYVGDLNQLLGGRNAAEGQPTVGRFPGYAKLSTEAILATDPDIIFAISAVKLGDETISDRLKADPAWSSLAAVKAGRVHEIDYREFLIAPGPRVGEALDTLFRLLYPGATLPS